MIKCSDLEKKKEKNKRLKAKVKLDTSFCVLVIKGGKVEVLFCTNRMRVTL
jgi:hypothetical protein